MRVALAAVLLYTLSLGAQTGQRRDEKYTQLIKEYLQDPRITTELVDHLPASDTVPSPLEFLGRAVGAPGELTYARDIHRYYQALANASPRARYFFQIAHMSAWKLVKQPSRRGALSWPR